MNTGRIENEPDAVYFGESDKPKFGSGAIKLWIQDHEEFYRRHVTGELDEPEPNRAMVMGHAVEEPILENKDRRIDSGFKTNCAKLRLLQETHKDKLTLTTGEFELTSNLISAGLADDRLRAYADVGTPQVTYRYDVGPFYLQARIDLEVDAVNATDAELGINDENCAKLLIDLKTTQTLYGQNAFAKRGLKPPLLYPVQEAYYREVIWLVTGIGVELLPFWFVALSKDELQTEWRQFADPGHKARNRVLSSIGELRYRFEGNHWDEFEGNVRTTFVPDNYLDWMGE